MPVSNCGGDLCLKRMYITGGIGPSASNEGFTTHYDLPDETAYAETCAAVGLVFWNHRMLQFAGVRKYADVMERALYNGTISGVSLDGRTFFYVNPLASKGGHHRKGWFDCACCPPNIARLIASVGGYVYSQGDHDAWIHLYAEGEGKLQVGERQVTLRQVTRYPWEGDVCLMVQVDAPATFTLHLRIPEWCAKYQVTVNGEPVEKTDALENGYLTIERTWSTGDSVYLNMEMPITYVQANPNVHQTLGRVALQRGPIVYCLEGCDHGNIPLDDIVLQADVPADTLFTPEFKADLLGGVTILKGTAKRVPEQSWEGTLYRPVAAQAESIELTAIPYYAWDNRAAGEMRVWFRTC